jgi:PQQ-like domain
MDIGEELRKAVQAYLCFCTLSHPFANCVTSGVSPDWRPSRPMTRQRKLDAGTGAKLWGYKTGRWVSSSPAVVNGVVYVGSDDGKVYAFGLKRGRE